MSYLLLPQFHDEKAAREFAEARVRADGDACPHCGVMGELGVLKG